MGNPHRGLGKYAGMTYSGAGARTQGKAACNAPHRTALLHNLISSGCGARAGWGVQCARVGCRLRLHNQRCLPLGTATMRHGATTLFGGWVFVCSLYYTLVVALRCSRVRAASTAYILSVSRAE